MRAGHWLQEMLAGGSQMARIESVEGTLYRVAGDSSEPIKVGEMIDEHEGVRTAKGSTALVRMADGSLIEMGERAGFALDASRKGNTIHLDGGRVIVEARLSKSGQALAQSGDLQIASGVIRTDNAAPLALRISKIIS